MKEIYISTSSRVEMIDITSKIKKEVSQDGIKSGVVTIFVPHTTAGVTINENADPDVCYDFLKTLNKLIPIDPQYRHQEGNSDSHLKASFVGSSVNVIVENSQLVLGTWQGIYFCEFDGARNRKVYLKIQKD